MVIFTPNTVIQSTQVNGNFDELKTKTDYLSAPVDWVEVTYLNSWVAYDSATYYGWYYRKDALGLVHLKGLGKSGTVTSGTPIFNLPAGYRPTERLIFITLSNGALARVDAQPNGDIITQAGVSNTWLNISGITFLAEG